MLGPLLGSEDIVVNKLDINPTTRNLNSRGEDNKQN